MADLSAYYRILDLPPGASMAEVKTAWRDLAQVWHPDRFTGNERLQKKAEEALKEINEAYHRLAKSSGATTGSRKQPRYEPETHRTGAAEPTHESILAEGVAAWNLWRKKYMDVAPRLTGCWLARRSLEGIDLREADLARVNFEGADLYKLNGSRANFKDARLKGAVMHRAIALEADFSGADFTGADLSSADLRGSTFLRARFDGANLLGVRFDGADLSGALGLTETQLLSALLDSSTKLPG
ncbi:MAG: pentapeptide repeat-containing protein [Acidobacteria bacterium]|nr:pentapeptide repeat-containing protein [Acidobacteriota bacterium]MDA1236917.1 pentapeptide repeat-containing protein [Acidobacteriota bacterium]